MNYGQALDYIHSFERFGWDLGLDRLKILLCDLGDPQEQLRCIHVAGSNGKGSVCNMTANILKLAGYRVGLYTSPFVVDFRERFQINGEMIGKDEFAAYTARLKEAIDGVNARGIHITEFEAITALGFLWFAEQQCDYLILEVGLGGRFDATNVISHPLLTAITSISLDHVNILGDTIEKIAFEKAGILKEGCVCCCYPAMHPDALGVLLERCAETGSRLVQTNPNSVHILQCDETGNRFVWQEQTYRTALVGKHQIYNALLVLSMLQELRKLGLCIPEPAVLEGLAATRFAARFEVLSDQPYIVVDGAHNPEGTEALHQTLSGIQRRKIVLMGMLADKDFTHSVAQIASEAAVFFAIPVPSPRALDPKETAKAAQAYCADVRCFSDSCTALREAMSLLEGDDMLLICGSLYMAGELRERVLKFLENNRKAPK